MQKPSDAYDQNPDGSYRKIQIRAKGGEYKIQARQGYYAMAKD